MNTSTPNHTIPSDWIKKWLAEVSVWKQMLDSRMEQNIMIKNNISAILKKEYNQKSLDEIEHFQTRSIEEDEIISVLKSEVIELDNLLRDNKLEAIRFPKTLYETIHHLREDMVYSEDRFRSLIAVFQQFQQKVSREKEN